LKQFPSWFGRRYETEAIKHFILTIIIIVVAWFSLVWQQLLELKNNLSTTKRSKKIEVKCENKNGLNSAKNKRDLPLRVNFGKHLRREPNLTDFVDS